MIMDTLSAICLIIAMVLFAITGFLYLRSTPPAVHLGWLGMVFLTIGLFTHIT
jgi:hypothetical protein